MRQQSTQPSAAIAALGTSKSFGGSRALRQASVTLFAGEVHGIAGENGSGKSTLLACLSGALAPDEGSFAVDGQERAWWRSFREAGQHGIALVSQELTLVPQLTVAQNVALASGRPDGQWIVTARRTERAVRDVLDRVGLGDVDPSARVASLPLHLQQLVEIARALSARPRVLLLDEPTSSLERHEARGVLDLARDLAQRDGLAVALITHRMRELMEYADRVTVLRDGECISQDQPRGQFTEESITRDMVGREIDLTMRAGAPPATPVVLQVRGLGDAAGRCRDIDLDVRRGEIVGLAGLVGAGRTELLETIYGLRRRVGGQVRVDGEVLAPDVRAVMRRGVRLVPDDRLGKALVPGLTVADNLDLDWRPRATVLSRRTQRRGGRDLMTRHRIAARSEDVTVRSLSGGNQQKIVFARQLKVQPRVLLLDEPTRGVDVGAKSDLYDLLRGAAADGACVVVASSELEELIQLCHRIFVMFEGRVVAEFGHGQFDDEAMAAAATGLAPAEVAS